MTIQVMVEVPNRLGQQLQRFQDRLPEVLERGLQTLLFEDAVGAADEQAIMAVLASQPTPEQIMALQPSPKFQVRVSDLLARSKTGILSKAEEAELERYLVLEHLVRLAKIQAYGQLTRPQ